MTAFSTAEILARLEILWRKLEDEGLYVRANTVFLAIDEIKKIRNQQIVWMVRPYEGGEWRTTTEPPTEEQRRYMEFVEVRPYTERSPTHYDSGGYCDNPGRGY